MKAVTKGLVVDGAPYEISMKDWELIAAMPHFREGLGLTLDSLLDRAIGVGMRFKAGRDAGEMFFLYGIDPARQRTVVTRSGGKMELLG